MEAIITIVGFLGAGKTTLIKKLLNNYKNLGWSPFVVLNDYENANLDAQQLMSDIEPEWVRALSGSCICCSGIGELREYVNSIPERVNGITLIEANGTSDACSLMGFLGVGLNDRFLPPVQISVVDVKNWQMRKYNNELEANQIQVSSLIILTHLENVTEERRHLVEKEVHRLNPLGKIVTMDEIDVSVLPELSPSTNPSQKLEHHKAHWSSASVDLPDLPNEECIRFICKALPTSIQRVKACAKIQGDEGFTFFERNPDGEVFIRPFYGEPITGTKLLTIGLGSDPALLEKVVADSIRDC